jgi:hypothetical protein
MAAPPMSEPPPYKVLTGADDDGRRLALRILFALLGWVLWAGLIFLLASRASNDALDAALTISTVIVTVAFLLVLTGAGLLRAPFMRERARTPVPAQAPLERPLPTAESPTELTGEIGLETRDGVRRYVRLTEASP